MKKLLFLAITSMLAFTSCSQDNETKDSDDIWSSQQEESEENQTGEGNEEVNNEDVDYIEDDQTESYNEEIEKILEMFKEDVTELTQLDAPVSGDTIALIKTNYGDITVKMLPEFAPLAVENFVTHSENGYYNDLIFHRVVENFVIQGGDPEGTGGGGQSIWGAPFVNEVTKSARHFNGALAMANAGADTNGSQFYIVANQNSLEDDVEYLKGNKEKVIMTSPNGVEVYLEDYYPEIVLDKYLEVGGSPALDLNYTVFGQVVEGYDVVLEISKVEVEGERPVEDVIIEGIEIIIVE